MNEANLLHPPTYDDKNMRQWLRHTLLILTALATLGLILGVYSWNNLYHVKNQRTMLQERIAVLQSELSVLNQNDELASKLKVQQEALLEWQTPCLAIQFLTLATPAMAENLRYEKIVYEHPGTLTLEGQAQEAHVVFEFIDALKQSGWADQVFLEHAQQHKQDDQTFISLRAKIIKN